jgi:hypothetical protein
MGYDPKVRTAAGNRKRLRDRASTVDGEAIVRAVQAIRAVGCARGQHRTDTDPETGDEVCRYCGTVTEG